MIKVNQTLFCKVTLAMFGHCAFEGDAEPQLTGVNVFYSVIIRDYSFGSLFSTPEAGRSLPICVCIGFHNNIGLIIIS